MKDLLHRIGAFLEVSLGLDQMGSNFKKFALMHTSFLLFQGLVSVYITTLLLSVSGDGNIVRWFNIISFGVQGVLMPFAVIVMRKYSTNLVTRIGIMGFILFYTVLLFTMNHADAVMPLLGALNGMSNAFYWLTYSSYVSAFTSDSKRDVALAFIGVVNGIVTLTMPVLSGFVIETIGGIWGYIIAFGVAFVVAIITILLSLRLPKHVIPAEQKITHTSYKKVIYEIVHRSYWRCGMFAVMMRGVRDGTFNFLLNLLLFEIISSETLTGINTLLVGLGAILSFWILGRILTPRNRTTVMLVGAAVLFAASAIPAFSLTPVGLIVFSVVNSIFTQFIVNPLDSIVFLLVQKKAERQTHEEFFAIRELLLSAGRIAGISLLFVFPETQIGYVIAIVILSLSQFLTVGFSKRALTLLKRDDEKELECGQTAEA